MPDRSSATTAPSNPPTPPSCDELQRRFLEQMRMRNCSPRTLIQWTYSLGRLIAWLSDHGIDSVDEVTPHVLSAYRRHLYHYRNPRNGQPIKFATQSMYLMAVRRWFHWLAEEQLIGSNPAAKLELPKEEHRLPGDVLTLQEAEAILNATDVTTPLGIRDRAIMETLYSTAMRCGECLALDVYDISAERGVITIRQGKGRKDRVVPIGERALAWIATYLADVRPALVTHTNETVLFVSSRGLRFGRNHLSYVVRRYIEKAGITKKGACHLFRHTAATLMMERGADVLALQNYTS